MTRSCMRAKVGVLCKEVFFFFFFVFFFVFFFSIVFGGGCRGALL